jgi:hypothetical protein
MAQAVRFLVEASRGGGLVARGIDVEMLVEAPSLAELERKTEERVREQLGADRGVCLLLGAPGTRRRPR